MAENKNIKQYTSADIEKYHRGLLSPKEKHDLEKAALEDPFLADALEGFAHAGTDIPADLSDLRNRLAARTGSATVVPLKGGRNFSPLMRAAAMILILATAGLLVYQFAFNKKETALADKTTTGKKEEIKAAPTDSPGPVPMAGKTETGATGSGKADQGLTTQTESANGRGAVKPGSETITIKDIAAEKTGETAPVVADNKPKGEIASTGAPVQPPATATVPPPAAAKETDKEYVAEEVKTRSAVAKKQETENNTLRKRSVQPAEDVKTNRDLAENRQADDRYYRNQASNTFRGRVTDASNTGIPFANLTNITDNTATYTDANGNFVLNAADSVLNVQVRSLGYDNTNVQLRNNVTSNNVVLQDNRRNQSEVVVLSQKPNTAARAKDSDQKLNEPQPADGWEKYDSYLANNLRIPEEYGQLQSKTSHSVQVSFDVDRSGKPNGFRIERSLCPACDKEAIRLIKDGPKWKRNEGKKTRAHVTINFQVI